MKKILPLLIVIVLTFMQAEPLWRAAAAEAHIPPAQESETSDQEEPAVSTAAPADAITMDTIVTPNVTAGTSVAFGVTFHAKAGCTIRSVELVTSNDIGIFPFDIAFSTYKQDYAGESSVDYEINLLARKNAAGNYYDLPFNVIYLDGTSEQLQTIKVPILVVANTPAPAPEPTPQPDPVKEAAPKVILVQSSTVPDRVVAGETFTLEMTYKNTSHSVTASSIKISLRSADEAFIPASGSSTVFIDSLSPDHSKSVSIELTSNKDLPPGTYAVDAALAYDAKTGGDPVPVTETATLSIRVIQIPKVQLSGIQILPMQSAALGDEVNVMVSVYNIGRSTLHNVLVRFESEGGVLTGNESFLGNIEQGKSGSADLYLSAVNLGDTALVMTASYEDDDGEVYSHTETIDYYVAERIISNNVIPEPDENPQSGLLGAIFSVAVLIAAGVALLWYRNKRKKKLLDEEDEFETQYLDAKLILDAQQSSEEDHSKD